MYRVLYRKWRPKTFDDVIGQPQVTRALASQIKENRLSHAYLFTGSRGTGKTSCAKIFSKAVNCLSPVNGNPCNECDICRAIDNGSLLDISEIDAASNRGIDDIRILRDEANFTPSMAKFRVFIIDEVHMLTIEAFNALLKTLEEPPEHVKFILATTEVQKLPATILSRCQRYDFRRIEPEIIADRITEIAEEEGARLEREGAMLIAKIADGAMRDALSLLDRCISVSDNVTASDVSAAAGFMGRDYLFKLCRAILQKDTAACLLMLGELHNASCDTERLCTELISLYRDLLIAKTVRSPENLIIGTAQELNEVQKLADEHTKQAVLRALSVLSGAIEAIKKTQNRRIEAELAFIRLCSPDTDTENAALVMRIAALEEALAELVKNGVKAPAHKKAQPTVPEVTQPPVEPKEEAVKQAEEEDDFVLPWNDLPDDIPPTESDLTSDYEDDYYDERPPLPDEPAFEGEAVPFFTEQAEPLPFDNTIQPDKPPAQPVSEPKISVPPATEAVKPEVSSAKDISSGEIPDRTWVDIEMEAERICKPLIGMLANSTARIQGSVVYIKSPNATFASLVKMPMFSSSLEKAIATVTGKKYSVKAE